MKEYEVKTLYDYKPKHDNGLVVFGFLPSQAVGVRVDTKSDDSHGLVLTFDEAKLLATALAGWIVRREQ